MGGGAARAEGRGEMGRAGGGREEGGARGRGEGGEGALGKGVREAFPDASEGFVQSPHPLNVTCPNPYPAKTIPEPICPLLHINFRHNYIQKYRGRGERRRSVCVVTTN